MLLDHRRRTYDVLAAELAALNDGDLAILLAETDSWRANIHGNQSGVTDVGDAKVFVKKIALTDLERVGENEGSTANLFDLPLFYHYGVISAGFGAWRELSAYLRASTWALSGEGPNFPLVYHWRVLPRSSAPAPSTEQLARIQRGVDHWDGSEAVRARLEAIFSASASIVVFLEYVPQTLRQWLGSGATAETSDAHKQAAILRFHDQWQRLASFMNSRGMLHFDLNASNILTDGRDVFATDFGLAFCADFDLSPDERAFFETHRLYDRCYADWAFVNWITPKRERYSALTPDLRRVIDYCAPVADIFGGFLDTLSETNKSTPYPAVELEAALAAKAKRS